jgi:hypothetical protein
MIVYINQYGFLSENGYKVELTGSYQYNTFTKFYDYEIKFSEIPISKLPLTKIEHQKLQTK